MNKERIFCLFFSSSFILHVFYFYRVASIRLFYIFLSFYMDFFLQQKKWCYAKHIDFYYAIRNMILSWKIVVACVENCLLLNTQANKWNSKRNKKKIHRIIIELVFVEWLAVKQCYHQDFHDSAADDAEQQRIENGNIVWASNKPFA